MRTIKTTVYNFEELSETAQEAAIDNLRDINTDHDWHESVYEDFKNICESLGIEVDLKKTYFSGFSHQGSGSSFTADIDILKCLEAVKNEAWKEIAPNQEFNFTDITVDRRVLKLIEDEVIGVSADVKPTNRESSITLNFNSNYYYNECLNYHNIDKQLESLEAFLEEMVEELNNFLYRSLERQYEYQASDEAIKETIIANEYEFTSKGKIYKKFKFILHLQN